MYWYPLVKFLTYAVLSDEGNVTNRSDGNSHFPRKLDTFLTVCPIENVGLTKTFNQLTQWNCFNMFIKQKYHRQFAEFPSKFHPVNHRSKASQWDFSDEFWIKIHLSGWFYDHFPLTSHWVPMTGHSLAYKPLLLGFKINV